MPPRRVSASPPDQNLRGCGRDFMRSSASVTMRKGADKIPGKRIAPPYNPPLSSGAAIAFIAEGGTGGELLIRIRHERSE